MKIASKAIVLIALCALILCIVSWAVWQVWRGKAEHGGRITETITPVPLVSPTATATPTTTSSPTPEPSPTPSPGLNLPGELNLAIPFTIQAPTANWDPLHEETCEEASILMAAWYLEGKQGKAEAGYSNRVDPADAEAALGKLVDWQRQTFGYFEDTTVAETKQMAESQLGLTARVIENPTVEAVKRELAQDKVVVVPAAGQLLKNPYFKPPGPPYHMLVIRGYKDNTFITNDPGTRRGEGLVYSQDVLMYAIHDWTGSDSTMNQGARRVLVLER